MYWLASEKKDHTKWQVTYVGLVGREPVVDASREYDEIILAEMNANQLSSLFLTSKNLGHLRCSESSHPHEDAHGKALDLLLVNVAHFSGETNISSRFL